MFLFYLQALHHFQHVTFLEVCNDQPPPQAPWFSMNIAPVKVTTELEAYTPPPEPVEATLDMNSVPVSTKIEDSLA